VTAIEEKIRRRIIKEIEISPAPKSVILKRITSKEWPGYANSWFVSYSQCASAVMNEMINSGKIKFEPGKNLEIK